MQSRLERLIVLLCAGINHRRMYFDSHPKVQDDCADFIDLLQALLRDESKQSFFLGLVDGNLVHNETYLVGPTIIGKQLTTFINNLHSGGLLFADRLSTDEITAFFALACEVSVPTAHLAASRQLLASHGVTSIELSPPYDDPEWFGKKSFVGSEIWGSHSVTGQDLPSLVPLYQSLFSTVETAHGSAASGHELSLQAARTASEELLTTTSGDFMDIMQLVRYRDTDSYTTGHSVRVALLLILVGHRLGMDQHFLLELGMAGLLHDIGKAKIPDEILYKRGPLTAEERRVVESHPQVGAQILIEHTTVSPLVVTATWGHHLRHDGAGYPARAAWSKTGNVASLLHVCDVFEALTAVRPYKPACTPHEAYATMLADLESFDPAALTALVAAMGFYPPGSQVQLSNGEHGVVVAAGAELDRPRVRVIRDENGATLADTELRIVDLSEPAGATLSVQRLLAADDVSDVAC